MFGSKKREPNFFDMEEERIQEKMATLEVGSEEYKEAQSELKTLITLRGDHKESKRRISKADKGQLLIKGLGLGGAGLLIGRIMKFERDGNAFTGENKKFMDSVVGSMGRIFSIFG